MLPNLPLRFEVTWIHAQYGSKKILLAFKQPTITQMKIEKFWVVFKLFQIDCFVYYKWEGKNKTNYQFFKKKTG